MSFELPIVPTHPINLNNVNYALHKMHNLSVPIHDIVIIKNDIIYVNGYKEMTIGHLLNTLKCTRNDYNVINKTFIDKLYIKSIYSINNDEMIKKYYSILHNHYVQSKKSFMIVK